MTNIVVKLPSIDKLKKETGNISEHLTAAAIGILRPDILRKWSAGLGGDGVAMPPLSPDYQAKKETGTAIDGAGQNRGGVGIRNLLLSGQMQRALTAAAVSKKSAKLFFADEQENAKAQKNHALSKNHMMRVEQKIVKKVTDFVLKKIRGK